MTVLASSSSFLCAECEAVRPKLQCLEEKLLYCESCSAVLHSKRARSHHTVQPLRTCDECETAAALLQCQLCNGDEGTPLFLCMECSSSLHSKNARSHHRILSIPFPHGVEKKGAQAHVSADEEQGELAKFHMIHEISDDDKEYFSSKQVRNADRDGCVPQPASGNHPLGERNHNILDGAAFLLDRTQKNRIQKHHNRREKKEIVAKQARTHKHASHPQNQTPSQSGKADKRSDNEESISSEKDSSADDETYGTKKYRKGSVTLEAFVVDTDNLHEGPEKEGIYPKEHLDLVEESVQGKIRKMLELGLHPNTPDIEAQQALRNAQRLLTKYNLSQVDVVHGSLTEVQALKGGMRIVELRSKKIGPYGRVEHWFHMLALTVAKYFDTHYFVQKVSMLQVVFYGIKQNADCAGYAFAASFNRITKLSAHYVPLQLDKGSSQCAQTRVSRMSYRNGLVTGLFETVNTSKKHQKPNSVNTVKGKRAVDEVHSEHSNTQFLSSDAESFLEFSSDDEASLPTDKHADWGCDGQNERGAEQPAALNALVLHSKKVGEDFLKEKKIKVKTKKLENPTIWDSEAFSKGKQDSSMIDLGQKGITCKSKVI